MSDITLREAQNAMCIEGHLNRALDAVISTNEPDVVFNILGELARKGVEVGYNATLKQQASRLDPPSNQLLENIEELNLIAAEKLVERFVETLQQCHAAIDPINHIHLNQMAQEKYGKRILYANDLLSALAEAAKWREGKE